MRNRLLAALGLLACAVAAPLGASARPLQLEDLFRLHRVSDPQISPDGRSVAYVVTDVLKSENRTDANLWLAPADGSGRPRPLTNSPKHDLHPRWSPDGRWLAYESARDGVIQIFLLPMDGGEPRKLTTLSTGASQPVWSRDGRMIAFVSSVYPEFSDKPFAESDRLNREKQEAREAGKVKARVIDSLLYRHWDEWVEGKRQHVFVVRVKPDGTAEGNPRDVTPGDNDGVPTSSTFAATDEFTFSPDGRELVFTAPATPVREQAWSTNHDLWSVDLATGKKTQLTTQPAADGLPRFSPDGRTLAYRAQERAGFEADRWQLWLLDLTTGKRRSLTAGWDRSVNSFAWAPDGASLFVEAEENGGDPLWSVAVADGKVTRLVEGGTNVSLSVAADGRWIAYSHQQMDLPPEVYRYTLGAGKPVAVTRTNAELLSGIELPRPESVTVPGAGGTPVQMWILRPPGFDAAGKYPLVYWVHGGPQGAWNDGWSTRWNAQLWAAQGYVLAMPNPRGSTGFGQKFTDEISHDWGGRVFDDLMACLAYLEKQPYVDTSRMAAAGASYGGYMMNWFEGHVQGRFRCLINHDGVYNFQSMYGTTEELWFDEWEHGLPWASADFEKYSPHRYAAEFRTPMLIIHNDLDFRVPVSEGLQVFTLLQRKGVASKLLMFPDEGHWVLKPQNSELWHHTVFDWLSGYLKN